MAKHTYRDRLVAGLKATGWSRDMENKSKYEAFVKQEGKGKLFVGPSGALRSGNCASNSYSLGCPGMENGYYSKVLAAGDAALSLVTDEQLLEIARKLGTGRGMAVA